MKKTFEIKLAGPEKEYDKVEELVNAVLSGAVRFLNLESFSKWVRHGEDDKQIKEQVTAIKEANENFINLLRAKADANSAVSVKILLQVEDKQHENV
ncbi:MAG: hypothetical protein U0V74_06060 [Chitinophagales bacterium]